MLKITWFEKLEDLQKLTGLTGDELWDVGFNLDDWDFGFCSEKELKLDAYDYGRYNCVYYYLMKELESNNYAFQPRHTEYEGKHYYMSYHS